jgi:hypothetical protein
LFDTKKDDELSTTSDDNEDPDQKNYRIMEKFLVSDLARQSIVGGAILACQYGDKRCSSEHPMKNNLKAKQMEADKARKLLDRLESTIQDRKNEEVLGNLGEFLIKFN